MDIMESGKVTAHSEGDGTEEVTITVALENGFSIDSTEFIEYMKFLGMFTPVQDDGSVNEAHS